jgi:hypothetical protein
MHTVIKKRILKGVGDYKSEDFVVGALLGIHKAYAKYGKLLTPHQCRGYIRSYTNEEYRRVLRKNPDMMDVGARDEFNEDVICVFDHDSAQPNFLFEEFIESVKNHSLYLHNFLNEVISGDIESAKIKYGNQYAILRSRLTQFYIRFTASR